jgi:RNA polymerase sigma-70 factor (ECF subfamily)
MLVRLEREVLAAEAGMGEVYEEFQPLMFSIAYRMLGSASDAEDVVQEAFLRFHKETSGGTEVDSAKAYLSAITTRLSIDHLRSARVRRERYVGTWLPEPLLTEEEDDVVRYAETADSLSMGFLVLLENLTPVERAVFLLHDVFEYDFDEISRIVGKTTENCRQISVRARRHIHEGRPRFEASRARKDELARRFFEAARDGDLDGLISMLAGDAVAYGDGGGKAPAITRPIHGRDKVAQLLMGARAGGERRGVVGMRLVEINGQPGALFVDRDDQPLVAVALDIADDLVQALRAVSNPEKLQHLRRSAEHLPAQP